jgi:hypothetical protein
VKRVVQGICPVCCQGITENGGGRYGGTVRRHHDTAGRRCPMSGQPMPVWDEAGTRRAVTARSGGICEWCSAARGAEMHHRKNRSQGGGWHPANILHLCVACHGRVTRSPDWARSQGLTVLEHQDAAAVWCSKFSGQLWLPSDQVTAGGPPPRPPGPISYMNRGG